MSAATPQAGAFRRDLGWYSLLTMNLGTVIGSGWLMLPGLVAAKAGPASIGCWVVAGLAMMVVALVFAELGAAWPAPGAIALYPRLSHGAFTAHLAGWTSFIAYAVGPPTEAVAVVRYAGQFAPSLVHDSVLSATGLGLAAAILAAITAINYAGVRYLAVFQAWLTTVKYIPILLFVGVVGLLAMHSGNFSSHQGGIAPTGMPGFMIGTASALFAYQGFRQALSFGGEARNPGRDIPLALILTTVLAMLTYCAIAVVFVGAINWDGLTQYGVQPGNWASLERLPAPVYDITAAAGIGFVAWLLLADGLISPNGPNATNVGSVARVAYSLAENGAMPRFFLALDPRTGTPAKGLIACLLLEVAFLAITAGGYDALVEFINVAFMVAYAMGPVAIIVLRRTAPEIPRPFRLPLANVLAPLAFVLASILLYWNQWPRTGATLGFVLFGVLIWLAYAARGRVATGTERHGLWLVVYLLAMSAISYLGDPAFGGIGVLRLGWDLAVIVIVALAIFRWAVSEREAVAYVPPPPPATQPPGETASP